MNRNYGNVMCDGILKLKYPGRANIVGFADDITLDIKAKRQNKQKYLQKVQYMYPMLTQLNGSVSGRT